MGTACVPRERAAVFSLSGPDRAGGGTIGFRRSDRLNGHGVGRFESLPIDTPVKPEFAFFPLCEDGLDEVNRRVLRTPCGVRARGAILLQHPINRGLSQTDNTRQASVPLRPAFLPLVEAARSAAFRGARSGAPFHGFFRPVRSSHIHIPLRFQVTFVLPFGKCFFFAGRSLRPIFV